MLKAKLIYSSGANITMQRIALRYGFLPGARLPTTIYTRPYFCDQEWAKGEAARPKYMQGLAKYRPTIASVIDWEPHVSLDRVLSWADEASKYVTEAVIIIPKVHKGVKLLPRQINAKQVRLGYSIPTEHGGTDTSIKEFEGWPVHLLGGDPAAQIRLCKRLNVISIDNNYIQEMTGRAQFWHPEYPARRQNWPTLKECGLGHIKDAPYISFELTCIAVSMLWRGYTTPDIVTAQYDWLSQRGMRIPARQYLFAS